jgi:hypothetical protein
MKGEKEKGTKEGGIGKEGEEDTIGGMINRKGEVGEDEGE